MFPELTERFNEGGVILAPYHSLVKPNGARSIAQGFDALASALSFVRQVSGIKAIVLPLAAMWADKRVIRPLVEISQQTSIHIVPVYRHEEQSDPEKNPLGLSRVEMKAKNENYMQVARKKLSEPGQLLVVSPYGLRQTPGDSPMLKRGFLELTTNENYPVVLAASGLRGVGFETVFYPSALDLTNVNPSEISDQLKTIYAELWDKLRC